MPRRTRLWSIFYVEHETQEADVAVEPLQPHHDTAAFSCGVAPLDTWLRNAPDPVPLLLLGQPAVDVSQHGKGLGRHLLGDGCLRALTVLQQAGFRALATHPIDEAAARFYQRFGFVQVPDSLPPLMVLGLAHLTAAAALARA